MASGRARLPPTPGTVASSASTASCARPTLTELHTNNNLYHSSAVAGDGAPSAVEYQQHPMHHPSHPSQQSHLAGGGATHHHHQLHPHQAQEVGMTAGATTSQMLPDGGALLGHGVTQSLRKPFDAPRHIPERPSQLADESDWMSDYADSNLKRRSSITKDYLPAGAAANTTDWLKKSIRRSWTISKDDNGSTRDPDVQPYPNPHLPRKQSQSSYPSLVKHPYFNPLSMADEDEYGEEEEERHGGLEVAGGNHRPSALRRAMPPRQSTLPNPEGIYYGSNNNLMPPVSVSPKQQLSPSPQYNTSPYHTDNEADNETGSDHRSPLAARYKIRRQSTLPCKPNEMLIDGGIGSGAGPLHGSGPKIMMSSSPNSRTNLYSKSPERDGIDAASSKQQQRFPPFVRQSTFPSNTNDPFLLQIQSHSSPSSSSLSTQPLQSQQQQQQQQQSVLPTVGQQRQLPTSPNRLVFNKSPDSGTESGPGASESSGTSPHQVGSRAGARNYTMTRQATLPNPEQHMKLLPTSPPKKQLSPHSIKRSPDFARQNTLPASQQQAPSPQPPPQQQQAQAQQPVAGPQSAPVLMAMPLAASSCSSLVGSDGTAGTAPAVTMNSLSVHQHGPKFMPISPRQKASFLFPQPAAPTPRPFHSQQHFPTHLNTSPSASAVSSGVTGTGTVPGIGVSHSSSTSLSTAVTSKMIKVRSHSNEEYTMTPATRAGLGMGTVSEGRRMLPEIPTGGGTTGPGGSRSPRLVRQEHVRDELLIGCVNSVAGQGPCSDKRTTTSSSSSPKQKTFAEAKQTMAEDVMGYELYGTGGHHAAAIGYEEFYDEDQEFSLDPIETGVGDVRYQDGEDARGNEQFNLLQMQQQQQQQQQRLPFVPNDASPDSVGGTQQSIGFGMTNRKDRLRSRRKSRDVYDQQDEMSGTGIMDKADVGTGVGAVIPHTEPVKRKPETMRSISEEAPAAKPPKPVYSSKKLDSSKIPSPKPLTELQDRQHKPSTAIGSSTSPRRKNIKSFDCGTVSTKTTNLQPGSYTPYQTPSDGGGSVGPSSVSPGIVTESSISSNTRTSGYGGSATTLASNIPGGPASVVGGAIGGFQSFGQRKISAFQQILQRQRLQKRDSKSLDIVASKLMEEKYGSRGQDVDVSKSLDDGIFSESAGHQSDDNSSDEHINLTYKPSSKDNKTTLGEAEIQNAVEAAAVIFKKVVLQRREENKCKSSNANHECHSSADGLTDESATLGGYSSSETEAAAGRMQSFGQGVRSSVMPSDYEEYRLVFFSSDSSSKEEEYDSSSTSSSNAVRHAKRHRYNTATASLDECDWDYFEPDMMPGADETKSAFFYEMLAMATATAQCVGSAHSQCKNTTSVPRVNSATSGGRKLDNRAEPSPTFCHCECCNRRQMQYVPIPVPVPVPVPIAAFQSWLYEQQQQLLLMHGSTEPVESTGMSGPSASDYALRTDLVQQLWKKFADSSETSVRNGSADAETSTGGNRKVPSHPKCACRFGSSRRDLAEACATSESHDSSDNERNATKVRTCKHLNVRHKSGVESERAFGIARHGSTGGGGSSGSEATAPNSRVHHVQKATPSSATSSPYGVMRRDSVGDGGISDSRCSLTSSDHDEVGSSPAVAIPTALQLVQRGDVVPPLRTGEFPLAVPVTTNAANDIVTTAATLAKPIQAQDNIVTGEQSKTANGRVRAREITPDSNVRAGVAATSSLVATDEAGLDTAATMDNQRLLCGGSNDDDDTGSAESSQTNDIDLRAQQQRRRREASPSDMDGSVNSDNKGTDTDNKTVLEGITYPPGGGTVVKAMEKNQQPPSSELSACAAEGKSEENRSQPEQGGSSEMRKSSKIRTDSVDEQDGYLQYELLYHLAQTGGRSSPSSSSASSSEAENTTPADQQGRKAKVGKYSFHLTGSSGGNSSYSSSHSSTSSLQEKCSFDTDTDGEEGDYFDRDHRALDDAAQEDDDGCCFDGEDDDEDDDDDDDDYPHGARTSGKRFNAVMVINPGHGSDGEGPSDSDSSDNQSIRTEGAHSCCGEVAGFPPLGGYADEDGAGGDDGGGVVVLKRVKNISDFEETECANEQQPKLLDDKLVRNCAEVSIEPSHNSSIVGRRPTLDVREQSERMNTAGATAMVVDHHQQQSAVQCTAPMGGSRKSGETDSSPLPNGEQPLVDQCCANVGESNAYQQQLEEKGTVSRQAPPEASGYARDADCQQQEHRLQQQRNDSIKVAEKPQHDDDEHQHYHNQDELPHTGNSISGCVTGVYRARTPTPVHGANAATCVSNATDECVSGATATHTDLVALGDIRSPETPHTVEAVPSSSTTIGGSNKYTSLVMITDDTRDTDSSESKSNNEQERNIVNESCIPSEGVVANEIQVNVASSSPTTETTTTSKTVPSGAEKVVCVPSDQEQNEITVKHIQHSSILASDDHCAVAETLSPLQSLPECLPGQSQTGSASGVRQHQHHHEHTSTAGPIVVALVRSDAADGDRKSSTEGYEKNPPLDAAGTVMDGCNSQSPLVQCAPPVMDEERFRGENVQVNSVDRSSDCDAFYQQMSIAGQLVGVSEGGSGDGVGETHQQCDHVAKAAGGNSVQLVRLDSADETNQVYSNEMERYPNDGNDDADDGGVDDGDCGGMQTRNGNVTSNENVTVTTGSSTLSAVICLEDGLADDDSWVEEISQDEEEFATTTATDSDLDDSSEEMSFSNDREEELRGYNRTAIDFTLHTIVEESCEDSEIESRGSDVLGRRRGRRGGRGEHGSEVGHDGDDDDGPRDAAHRLSASELEKYFFYGLGGDVGTSSKVGVGGTMGEMEGFGGTGYGGGMHDDQSEMSEESSSLCSDGHDSLGSGTASGSASAARLSGASMESHDRDHEDNGMDSVADLASSRLEKYFLTGFLGYNSTDRGSGGGGNGGGGGGNGSDGSGGSVGSDSEGHVSPEQRRKRLVRARGATRSHSSLDNLLLAGKDAEHNHESIGSNVSQSASSSYDTACMIASGSGSGGGPVGGGNADVDHSSETDTCDEATALYSHQERSESSPYDTMGKRKKKFMTKKMDVALARAEQQQQHHGIAGDAGPGGICSEAEDSRKTPLQSTSLDVASGREMGVLPSMISPSLHPVGIENSRKQTSRDSGFIGSNDDLLKEDQTVASSSKATSSSTVEPILEENKSDIKEGGDVGFSTEVHSIPSYNASRLPISPGSSSSAPKSSTQGPGMVNLVRKDSFNNWSSDEETNLMMSKMRQFFKSLVAASANTRKLPNSCSSTPGVSGSNTPQQGGSTPVARPRGMRTKPPQLVYFENELTRLMKTVPGIRDEQVREIVEYLSSEDTWSDSYDSSDYTSSDLEGTAAAVAEGNPFGLQEEISASCRQIINKFDSSVRKDEEGDIGDGGLVTLAMSEKEESPLVAHHRHHHPQQQQQPPYHQTPLSKETAFVYQRLVASLSKVVSNESPSKETKDPPVDMQSTVPGIAATSGANSSSSPPLIAKVMHHIGSRLVALMHEVSSGESHASVSPKQHRIGAHRKSGQTMASNVGCGVGIGAGIGNTSGGIGSMVGHHHHHHHHHHHQIISATTTEDDEDSSTSESNDRQHPHHYHHHRSRLGLGGATAPGSTPAGTQEDEEEIGIIEGGASTSSSSYAMMLPRSKSHDLLLSDQRSQGHYQYHSGTGSDMVGEERGEASDYERFSWRGSFESALLANGDSRTKLSMLDNSSSSKSILVAKRRSAGDLLFNNQNLSQEQLDRVRSCGSIGGDREEFESSKLWEAKQQQPHQYQQNQPYHNLQQPHQQLVQHHQHYAPSSTAGSRRRLSSVAADEEDTDSDEGVMKGGGSNRLVLASRSTLPRSLQNTMTSGTTNSLPRLPTSNLQTIMQSVASSSSASSSSGTTGSLAVSSSAKPTTVVASGGMGPKSQSVYHFLQNNVKSARYRAPGFNRPPSAPKRAMSAPGLQPPYPRRERRSRLQHLSNEESGNSPDLTGSTSALGGEDEPQGSSSRATAGDTYDRQPDGTASNGMQHKGGSMVSSPVGSAGGASDNWPSQSDEDIDRLVALHQNRASLSSLGVRSDSMASVYSGAGEGRYGTVTVRGQIEFGMQYNYKQGALEIHVKQCKDLAAVDTKRNRSDPYVKVYLLPDKSKSGKRKTKVKKHTLNPVFDEVLRFHMSLNSLQTRTIWITVWHSDMFGRNDFLGEVMMGLQDKVFDNPQPQWYQLQERSEPFEDLSAYKGDIIVGLKYVSADADSGGIIGAGSVIGGSGGSAGSGFGTLNLRKFSTRSLTSTSSSTLSGHSKGALHVLVKEAKHLQPIKSNGTCDAFCKSYLLPDKNRSSKQKTPVIKRTNSPVWNYTFVYEDVSLAELSERALELTIWDHDRLASNEFLGGVRFSLGNGKHNGRAVEWMDSTGKELSLWQNMINRPNFWVEGALVLRPSLENAKFST
uniref:C2 domain-containing protein n=2 Tax=Anopheles funestus TaxID=62324 RepID=A0A182RQC8_ANOFN